MPAFLPLAIPPGVVRQGTEYQIKGRAWDANLVRWYGAQVGPIRGWQERGDSTVSGVPRCLINWRGNSQGRWSGIGTHTKLYAANSAADLFDITPTDFVAGDADASPRTGFGYGVFGSGTFGTPRPDSGDYAEATVWDLDNWGQYLVGCAECDGRILQWQLDTGTDAAAVTNAPTSCNGTFVTAERAHVALGASGNPRTVKWSDLEVNTTWSASSTNKAGDYDLVTHGKIMCGRRMPDQAIILTDLDAWTMTYVGDVFVYGFKRVGDGCGALSRGCIAVVGNQAVWWGKRGFWVYDGAVRPLRCDVQDYLQNNLNNSQRSKITCFHNSKYGEVWWFYPSSGTNENDSYVVWDYQNDVWNIGSLNRTCAADYGVFQYPIAFDEAGQGYEHEVGSLYGDDDPYVRYGPVELGNGDRVMRVTGLIADEATNAQATVSFHTRFYPNGTETVLAEATLSSSGKTDIRFTARQAEMVVTFTANNAARWGTPRLALSEGGRR